MHNIKTAELECGQIENKKYIYLPFTHYLITCFVSIYRLLLLLHNIDILFAIIYFIIELTISLQSA